MPRVDRTLKEFFPSAIIRGQLTASHVPPERDNSAQQNCSSTRANERSVYKYFRKIKRILFRTNYERAPPGRTIASFVRVHCSVIITSSDGKVDSFFFPFLLIVLFLIYTRIELSIFFPSQKRETRRKTNPRS